MYLEMLEEIPLRLYETTIIVDSVLKTEEIDDIRNRFSNFVSNNGGEIVKIDEWGKRRLAYEINKKQYGYYIHSRFFAEPTILALLEKEFRLNEVIMRSLTVSVDKRALKKEESEVQMQQSTDDIKPIITDASSTVTIKSDETPTEGVEI